MTPAAMLHIRVQAQGIADTNAKIMSVHRDLGKVRDAASQMGAQVAKGAKIAGVGVVAGLGYAVKKAADFEAQMSSLEAVTDAAGGTMGRFRKQAMRAGADTKYSALQAAQAQTELAKGGLSTAQIMSGGLKSALALAAAGEMDLGEAASTTVTAMKLFGIEGGKSMMVADALATAANKTTADVSDFGLALKMGGSVAKLAGLSFNDTVVALESLAEAGIKGSDAGTSMKAFFLNIATPSAKAREAMKSLGVEIFDSQGKLKSLPGISENLRQAFGRLTKEQFLNKAGTIAGSDAIRFLYSLYDAGPSKLDALAKANARNGVAADIGAKKLDNLKGKLENLQGSVETIAISIGTKMLPALTRGTVAATDFLNGLSSGRGAGGGVAAEFARMGAAAGLSSADVRQAGQAIANAFELVRAVAQRVWPGVRQTIQGQLRTVGGVVKVFAGLLTLDFGKAWEGVRQIFSGALSSVAGRVRAAGALLGAAASAAFSPVGRVASTVFGAVRTAVGSAIAFVLRRVSDLLGGFSTMLSAASRIPGIGGRFRDAARGIDAARDSLRGTADAIDGVRRRKDTTVRVTLEMAVKGLKGQVSPLGGGRGDGWGVPGAVEGAARDYAGANRDRLAALFSGSTGALGAAAVGGTGLNAFNRFAARFGVSIGSGLRPGAVTSTGNQSYHAMGRARDFPGPPAAMLAFARFLASRFGGRLKELIHTPLGFAIKNGARVAPYAQADHYDHVHVAMRRGGMVPGSGPGDKVRALLEPGEGIVNRRAVGALGGPRGIDAINAAVPRFQRGGVVGMATGGIAGLGGALDVIRGSKRPKARSKALRSLLAQVRGIGLGGGLERSLAKHAADAASAGDLASRAQQLGIDGPDGNPIPGSALGRTEGEWLTDQVGSLFALRNALIRAQEAIREARERVSALLEEARRRHEMVSAEIRRAAAVRDGVERDLREARKKPKANAARIRALGARARDLDAAQRPRVRVRDTLARVPGGVIATLEKRRTELNERRGGLLTTLGDVQGVGSPGGHMAALPPLGVLGGQILAAQVRLRDLGQRPAVTDPSPAASAGTDGTADLLREQLRLANLRTAVSQAQYQVFAGLSRGAQFAGTFHGGGIVPGPPGQERTARVKTREGIFTEEQMAAMGGPGDVRVIVNGDIVGTPAGRDPVEVVIGDRRFAAAVERVGRGTSRGGRTPLPSAGGGL